MGSRAYLEHVPLTERELEILKARAEGLSVAEVGAQLFLSPHTVKSHCLMILGKLGAKNTAHAVTIGFRKGLLK